TDDTDPYSFDWNGVKPGYYLLRAKLTASSGATVSSEPVKIMVVNGVPTVKITAPADKSVLGGPTDIDITVDASDPDGTAPKVTLYGDAQKLGTLTAAPYAMKWSKVTPGKHIIIVTATDPFGAFSSAAVTITVTNPPPVVNITSPANNDSFTAPAAF